MYVSFNFMSPSMGLCIIRWKEYIIYVEEACPAGLHLWGFFFLEITNQRQPCSDHWTLHGSSAHSPHIIYVSYGDCATIVVKLIKVGLVWAAKICHRTTLGCQNWMDEWANVQKQMNGSDCGLFAIAFATALCQGQRHGRTVLMSQRWGSTCMTVSTRKTCNHSQLKEEGARRRTRNASNWSILPLQTGSKGRRKDGDVWWLPWMVPWTVRSCTCSCMD